MSATVFYRKHINGRLCPKAARIGPYSFAQEVSRVNGRVVTLYLGIVKVEERTDIVEMEEGSNADQPGLPEEIQQKLQ